MTNAEKFEEVFGVRPDIETMVLDCPTILQSECQYREDVDMFCHCERWWDEEYKEKPMIDIIPPEEEEKTLKINFTEEQKQAFEEVIARQNKLLLKAEPLVDNIPPDEPFEGIEEIIKEKAERSDEINKLLNPDTYYLKEISSRKF